MINWKEINGLHAIAKLEEILCKWYNVEVIFTDEHCKIQGHHQQKDYEFKNHLFRVQIGLSPRKRVLGPRY